MSDLMKFILVVILVVGAWFFMHHRGEVARKFQSDAGKSLVMLQGSMPSEGKPVVLEFWGTYCPPCLESIPHLNRLYDKFGGAVQFIAVSAEEPDLVRAFTKRVTMKYPVAVDVSQNFSQAWDVKGIPLLVYLDANQKEQWRGHSLELTDAVLGSLIQR